MTIAADPSLGEWGCTMPITFSGHTTGRTDLVAFPALVVFRAELAGVYDTFSSPQGYDLRFGSGDRRQMYAHEVESWDATSNSYVWVRVSRLSGTNTTIWACWNNPEAATAPVGFTTNGSAWNSGFLGVWHLAGQDAAGRHPDSTASRHHGTERNSVDDYAGGAANGAQSFDADADEIAMGLNYPGGTHVTLEAWARHATVDDKDEQTYFRWTGGAIRNNTGIAIHFYVDTDNGLAGWPGPASLVNGKWTYAAGRWHAGSKVADIFQDGRDVGGGTAIALGAVPASGGGTIGYTGAEAMRGELDEIRVSTVLRSDEWIWATYQTIASNNVFTTYGDAIRRRRGTVLWVR